MRSFLQIIIYTIEQEAMSTTNKEGQESQVSKQSFLLKNMGLKKAKFAQLLADFSLFTDKCGKTHFNLPSYRKSERSTVFGFQSKLQQVEDKSSPQAILVNYQMFNEKIVNQGYLLVPKPTKPSCFNCKVKYTNYLCHILTQTHKETIKDNDIVQQVRNISEDALFQKRPRMLMEIRRQMKQGMNPRKQKPLPPSIDTNSKKYLLNKQIIQSRLTIQIPELPSSQLYSY